MNTNIAKNLSRVLLGGTVAVTLFTACTDKDLYDPTAARQQREAQYAKDFQVAFGAIDPNQDWGFGTSTSRATRAVETITIPTSPAEADAANFYDAVPAGVELYPNKYLSSNGTYYLDNSITYVDFQASNGECGKLYVTGNVTPSGNFYLGAGTSHWDGTLGMNVYDKPSVTLYLCKGATLNLTSEQAANLQGGVKIYMAQGSKIRLTDNSSSSKIVLNSTEIYNQGTIEAYNIELNGQGLLYNCASGKMFIEGNIKAANHNCKMVNEGYVNCGSFGTEGSSALWNRGEMKVNGATIIDSNCATFVNDGKYTTGSLSYTAGSTNVINACWLTVMGTLKMTLGDTDKNCFYIGANGAVVAKKVEMLGPGYVKMGSNSLLKATEEIVVGCTKDNYGIHGIGDKYAVVSTPKVAKAHENQGYEVSYSGKLYVATDSHFEQGYSGQYPYIHMMDSEAQIITGSHSAPITIPASECSPGYTGGAVIVTHRYRVFAEDLGADHSDWDFNDVVFDVIQYSNNSTDIVLQAAGGKLQSELEFANDKGGIETINVHGEFKVAQDVMVNTNHGTTTVQPVPVLKYNYLIEPRDIQIYITYKGGERCAIPSEKGQAAGKFCVDYTGINEPAWMDEYDDIRSRYSDFGAWVNDASHIWWDTTPVAPAAPEEINDPIQQPEEEIEDPIVPEDPNVDPQQPEQPETPSSDYGVKYAGTINGNFTIDYATYLTAVKNKVTITFKYNAPGKNINGKFTDKNDEWTESKQIQWGYLNVRESGIESMEIPASHVLIQGKADIEWLNYNDLPDEVYIKCE